jgi:hypothetical protein
MTGVFKIQKLMTGQLSDGRYLEFLSLGAMKRLMPRTDQREWSDYVEGDSRSLSIDGEPLTMFLLLYESWNPKNLNLAISTAQKVGSIPDTYTIPEGVRRTNMAKGPI